ncbi:MAG: hypothetical protein D6828_05680 [Nitrospirae bacterium]|nr:MAG: hypothetical protein D6828_05680 [Nitrospirota bacterium]
MGNREDAIKTLDKLKKLRDGVFMDTALYREAVIYEKEKRKTLAAETYLKIVNGFPNSPWYEVAMKRIEALEAKGKKNTLKKKKKKK